VDGVAAVAPPLLIALVGPTAAGKSALGLRLAVARGGEIVSCDSLQVYRGFDVGSAKPTIEERRAHGIVQQPVVVATLDRRKPRVKIIRHGFGI